jgi:hypothetical protein
VDEVRFVRMYIAMNQWPREVMMEEVVGKEECDAFAWVTLCNEGPGLG